MKKTFNNFDKLQRKDFAEILTQAISLGYDFSEGSYVVSLNASFGTGKTTFIEMWKEYLEQKEYKTILINAWETDFANDPIIPIISSLLRFLNEDSSTKDKIITQTKHILKKTLGALAITSGQLINKVTGIDINETKEELGKKDRQDFLDEYGNQLFEDFNSKETALKALKAGLTEYIETLQKKPLIILVDELDRARPNYSVEFLETIKHIFAIKGIVFVLAVDKNHLKSAMQVIYGKGLDFDNYYRRFALRDVTLPSYYYKGNLNANAPVKDFVDKVYDETIQTRMNNINFPPNIVEIKSIFDNIAILFSLTLREIEYCFRVAAQFLQITNNSNPNSTIKTQYLEASIFLIALSVKDEKIYHEFCKNHTTPDNFFNYITSINGFKENQSLMEKLIYTVFLSNINTANYEQYFETAKSTIMTFGYSTEKDEEMLKQKFDSSLEHVAGTPSCFRDESINYSIYTKLESWRNIFDR